MNKTMGVAWLLAAALGGASGPALAEYKVGYVDATKVFEESPQYEEAREGLKSEFTRRENEILGKQKELKKLEEKLNRDGDVMSESELSKLEREIITMRRRLKNSQDEFREDLTIRQNEEFNKLRRQVSEVVRQVGKDGKFDLVLTDGVVYFSKRVDISDQVLDTLRTRYKAGR